MILNLGSGAFPMTPAVNVDRYTGDVQADLLDLPFRDGVADAVYAIHVLEHFTPKQAIRFLRECYRVMKDHQRLVIEGPDIEKCASFYKSDGPGLARALYGDQDGKPEDAHRSGWWGDAVVDLCLRLGFQHPLLLPGERHGRPGRDYCVGVLK